MGLGCTVELILWSIRCMLKIILVKSKELQIEHNIALKSDGTLVIGAVETWDFSTFSLNNVVLSYGIEHLSNRKFWKVEIYQGGTNVSNGISLISNMAYFNDGDCKQVLIKIYPIGMKVLF